MAKSLLLRPETCCSPGDMEIWQGMFVNASFAAQLRTGLMTYQKYPSE